MPTNKQIVEPELAATSAPRERLRQHLRRTAYWMDELFTLPGTRWKFGVDAIIGLVPVVGDLAGYAMGAWMVWEARSAGVPRPILQRMLRNLGLEALVGLVPLAGDLFDVAWRAHSRNRALVEQWLDAQDGIPEPLPRRRWGGILLLLLVLLLLAYLLYPAS